MDLAHTPAELARMFSAIGIQLLVPQGEDAVLTEICRLSLELLPSADAASISRGCRGRFVSIGATSDLATAVDQIQYDLGSGPCVDAAVEDTSFRASDLAVDPRWPDFGRQAAELGALSMLATRIFPESVDLVAAVNVFSTAEDAFSPGDEVVALMLATHASLAITAARSRESIANLERAVQSNRGIGVAMGVLMSTYKITSTEAFDLLRLASQNTHRKLYDVAADVTETGMLDVPTLSARRLGVGPKVS